MTRAKKKTGSANKKPQILPGIYDIVPGVDHSWQLAAKNLDKYARA
jgi:hypothetical protein